MAWGVEVRGAEKPYSNGELGALELGFARREAGGGRLEARRGIRDAGFGMRDAGFGMQDTRCWMLDVGCSKQDLSWVALAKQDAEKWDSSRDLTDRRGGGYARGARYSMLEAGCMAGRLHLNRAFALRPSLLAPRPSLRFSPFALRSSPFPPRPSMVR